MSHDSATRRRHILVVLPDACDTKVLTARLASDPDYAVEIVTSAFTCVSRLAGGATTPDAILLAHAMPDADGAEFCFRLRQRGLTVPILLVGTPASEPHIVRALDLGASDVIVSPLRPAEGLARLRAQIRAHEASEDAVLSIGPFQFRPARRQLLNMRTGGRTLLTEKEAAVLKFLCRATAPVPRSTLLREVWGYKVGASTHTVETHIYRLRRKIGPEAGQCSLVVNEHGGYRLRREPQPDAAMPWTAKMIPGGDAGQADWLQARMRAL